MQPLVLVLAMICAVPLICRLSAYDHSKHLLRIAVLHTLLSISVAWAGIKAAQGQADFGDLCTVLAALAWVWVSYHSWRHGVPKQFHKRKPDSEPRVLDFTAMSQVWGRGPK